MMGEQNRGFGGTALSDACGSHSEPWVSRGRLFRKRPRSVSKCPGSPLSCCPQAEGPLSREGRAGGRVWPVASRILGSVVLGFTG